MIELIIALIVLVMALGYYYVRRKFDCFKRLNIPHVTPIFPLGNAQGFGKIHTSALHQQFYNKFVGKAPIAGMYFFLRPVAIAVDPELIKNILVRDFSNFADRGLYTNETVDPLWSNLFTLDETKWRRLRNKLTPTFTSGKMKLMFDIIEKTTETMNHYLKDFADRKEEIEFRDLFGRLGNDVIANCAFGIECNSLEEPENEFRKMGKKIFAPSKVFMISQAIGILFPKLAKMLNVRMTEPEVADYFLRVFRETFNYRKENNVKRNDFFQLLMDLEKNENCDGVHGTDLTFEEMAAQSFLFFLAGFETSATTLSFCVYELGRHPDIQQRMRDEIEEVLIKHNGKVTYESLTEMHFMNQVINETLRLYPPLDSVPRKADKDYIIHDTEYKIEKGMMVLLPIFSIQRDPQYYPDPLKFDPERFSKEETAKRHPFTFIPFGEGPRNCIGMRFGLMQVRLGLISILRNYKVSHSARTPKAVKFIAIGQTLMLDGGAWLKIENIKD